MSGGTFPTGSFNHSYGLETYIQSNAVQSAEDMENILITYLDLYNLSDMIFVKEAYEAVQREDMEWLAKLQEMYSAMKLGSEIYRASIKTGRSFLNGVKNLFLGEIPPIYKKIADVQIPYHYAICYGIVAAILDLPKQQTFITYAYTSLASLISVAARIIPLGQNEAQALTYRISKCIDQASGHYEQLSLNDLCTFAPGLEIASMEHETLYTRLCMS